ncbi:hypothetical protein ElyMa_002913500 [Elysia marginata]|uniref:Reverse transcriptase domain-containing protein n=1 Tax=Elysia marginata TaxID=1093978 RepID=A0AAV4I604_9GAST|nr:hypothetical protein ElyMa_002913500 [Elysia marginata]
MSPASPRNLINRVCQLNLAVRQQLSDAENRHGILSNLLKPIGGLNTNSRGTVRTPDRKTEKFAIKAGVLQGDTLAQFLLIINFDYALWKSTGSKEVKLGVTLTSRKSAKVHSNKISDRNFAVDVCLLGKSIQQAQQLLSLVVTSSKGQNALKRATQILNLCPWVESTQQDLPVRTATGMAGTQQHEKASGSFKVSKDAKASLFRAGVELVLLYGCNTWTLAPTLE